MKIFFLNSHPIEYFSDMYRHLTNEKIDIEVWYCSKFGTKNYHDKEFNNIRKVDGLLDGFNHKFLLNINPFTNAKEKLFDTINPLLFMNLLKLNRKDIIICHGWSRISMISVIILSKFMGFKVGIRCETPLSHEKNYVGFRKYLRKNILKLLFKLTDYFFYIGTNNYNFYKEFGVADDKLIFMPYSVKPKNNDYEYRHKNNTILFCGKLIDKKRPIDLLEAFSLIENKNSKLYFAGNGVQKELLISKSIEFGIKDRVMFLGLQDRVSLDKLYSKADVLVLPSGFGETWGLVINEGLEWGTPVVISDMVGCANDLCQGNGYVFQYKNVEDLVLKLNNIYNMNDEEYQSLVINSHRAKNKFSFNKITLNLTRFIKQNS